ncbi:MAG TPA: DNA polymerase III subunit chi [Caulobacteraceae bacterium]|nr:DNA polymerase III subunit chi [Caulobacteraceae bacterium]
MADAAAQPCEVWFYHLERSTLDQVLPELLERTLARGWRALVRSPMRERLDQLDGYLWSYRDDGFLPHGLEDEPQAELQPVLLTTAMAAANGAQALFLIDGAEPGELAGFARCLILFDGCDEAALAAARARWKALKETGLPLSYWKQTERGWEKAA